MLGSSDLEEGEASQDKTFVLSQQAEANGGDSKYKTVITQLDKVRNPSY